MSVSKRIYLSPPHLGGEELLFVEEAFESNYIAPMGPQVDAFEEEFCAKVGAKHAAAVTSGTAALHLVLRLLGVEPGDEVWTSTLTFIGSVSPITYLGARPVFIDSDRKTWNMDPGLVTKELKNRADRGKLPKAVVLVHLYGQCADIDPILECCKRYGVALVEDAAESLGATYKGCQAGTIAHAGIFSFNGNKIITTSGGGMVVSDDESLVEQARLLSAQAREPTPHYEHSQIGYNYRMSNILAAIGRGQLKVLDQRVEAKRNIFNFYREALGDVPGIEFMPEAPYGKSNRWLTVILITPDKFGGDHETVRLALEAKNIESRPIWKPMHLQPVFEGFGCIGGRVAEELFREGLCLPSGTAMSEEDLNRIVRVLRNCRR
jgi:pyridoxal phosphate-dependent aminotransferase EpsN